MQHEQPIKKHLAKRTRNWFTTGSFYISLLSMVFILLCFRFPDTSGKIEYLVDGREYSFSGDERKLVFYQKRNGETGIESKQTKSNNRETESFDSRAGSESFSAGERRVDLDRLARAVAVAETSGCTRGTGITHLNCFGIKENGAFVKFDSHAASFRSFKWNWEKHYGEFPDINDAIKWTGNDRAESWLEHVIYFYENN